MRGPSATGLVVGALAGVSLRGGWAGATRQDQDPALLDRAAALQKFARKAEHYATLRARYEAPLPPFEIHRDPWSLRPQRADVASAIRTARRHAQLGDLFTEPVARMLREDIARAVYEVDIEGLVGEDFDVALVDLAVNEPIPLWAMRPVPDALLERLPPLPYAIEYRLVADALILWDTHAEILIDALPGAFVEP